VQTEHGISREQRSGGAKAERASRAICAQSSVPASSQIVVSTNLPKALPPLRDELALWRAFLSEEIGAILRDEG
jgi:hypothetical protein